MVVMGVPSHGFRSTLKEVALHIRAWVPVISLAKGLEQGTNVRMTEVINDELSRKGDSKPAATAAASGTN